MGRLVAALVELLLLGWAAGATWGMVHYRRLLHGLDEPELWLPRRERRAHARKLLRREDDEYSQQQIEKIARQLREGNQL